MVPSWRRGLGLGGRSLLTLEHSDREIDAIPGTYDDVKGKKYPAVNRQVNSFVVSFGVMQVG
jgi:hypothetical protein